MFTDQIAQQITSELNPALSQEHIKSGRLLSKDIAACRFSFSELEQLDRRKQIEVELVTKDWEVTISKVLPTGDCGFVSHPKLSDGAIVYFDQIDIPNGKTIRVGDRLRVRLKIQFNRRHDR